MVWHQPPDDVPTSGAFLAANNSSPSTPAHSPSHAFGTDVTQAVVNKTPVLSPATLPPLNSSSKCAPKSSGVSQEAIEKAHSYIEKIPQKRTLLDMLIELQEYVPFLDLDSPLLLMIPLNKNFNRKNTKMWNDEMKEKLLIQKQAHILEEFKLGLVDKEGYLEKITELDGGGCSAKHQNTHQFSPDWNNLYFYVSD